MSEFELPNFESCSEAVAAQERGEGRSTSLQRLICWWPPGATARELLQEAIREILAAERERHAAEIAAAVDETVAECDEAVMALETRIAAKDAEIDRLRKLLDATNEDFVADQYKDLKF